ncbi:MAG TPA: hypothetical protein VGX00_08545 [Thermoplasmata archaeon]|nr:hypothetical protein [Thermoplasmata archaeon]
MTDAWSWFVARLKSYYAWRASRRIEEVRAVQQSTGLTLERAIRLRVYELDVRWSRGEHRIRQAHSDLSFRFSNGHAIELPPDSDYDTFPATDARTLLQIWQGRDDKGNPYTANDAIRTGHLVDEDPSRPIRMRDIVMFQQALPELRKLFGGGQ